MGSGPILGVKTLLPPDLFLHPPLLLDLCTTAEGAFIVQNRARNQALVTTLKTVRDLELGFYTWKRGRSVRILVEFPQRMSGSLGEKREH